MSAAQKAPERKPLLELSTLAPERPFALVDEHRHDFRLLQEFGAVEHQEFTRKSRRYDELWNGGKLTRSQANELDTLLDWLFDHVLVNPAAAREKIAAGLTGAAKREFVLTFTNAPLLMAAMAQQTTEARESSTTES